MKKLIYILAVVFVSTTLLSCQKETPQTDNSPSSYLYSLKGESHANIKVKMYEIEGSGGLMCGGYFIKPLNKHFDFIIEVEDGMPLDILTHENLENMEFEVDIEFTGIAYNCKRSYKTDPEEGRGYPVEIQKAKITRFIQNQ